MKLKRKSNGLWGVGKAILKKADNLMPMTSILNGPIPCKNQTKWAQPVA